MKKHDKFDKTDKDCNFFEVFLLNKREKFVYVENYEKKCYMFRD